MVLCIQMFQLHLTSSSLPPCLFVCFAFHPVEMSGWLVVGGAVQQWLWRLFSTVRFQMSPQMIFSTLPFIEMLLRQLWWLGALQHW